MQQYSGMWLGAYQIVEQIGQGGMATVFKAYQPSMDRYVAIKILPRHLSEDESFVARFNQEARTLARLEHPHILPVHDYGEQDGLTYLVMRCVEAGTLKDVIAQHGPLPLEEAARILEQVGRALDYAHSQGVLHRDIKPSNILVDARRDTFLTDFGIAKLMAETAQFTASGALIGTPAYMSPEQGMGQPVDHRCDIYALGVVLYELVTGRVPYEAETPLAVVLKHINDPLPLPRQVRPGLLDAVERVILKAMAKAPKDRFASAGAMVRALQQAVAALPAAPAPPPEAGADVRPAPVTPVPSPLPPATTPPPEATATPPVARSATTPPPAAAAQPAATAQPAPTSRPRATPAPAARRGAARKGRPWLPIAIAAGLVAVVLVTAIILLSIPDGGASPTRQTPAGATPGAGGGATPAPSPPAAVSYSPGWTSFTNGNLGLALVRQGDLLWVGGESGLVRWNLRDGTYDTLGIADGLASSRVNDLQVDWDGVLWVATDGGVNRFDGDTWITFDETDGLDAPWIEALFVDHMGGIWAGSAYGERGLNYYDGSSWQAPPIPPLPVEFPSVTALVGSEEDGLFVGLENNGLAYFDGQDWLLLGNADGMPGEGVLSLLLTYDALWAGFDDGLVRFTLDSDVWDTFPDLYIYAMLETSDGLLWFGGEDGVVRLDRSTGDWQSFNIYEGTFPASVVTGLVEGDGGIWCSTWGDGVVFFDGSAWESWVTEARVGGNWIEAIRQDGAGALWFSHPGTGLTRHDPARDTWQTFGEADGVPDWPSLPAVDSAGALWIGGAGRLLRYDGASWETFAPPELEDLGIYAIEIAPDDVMWLDTDAGLMRHEPSTESWTVFTGADHPILDAMWTFHVARDGTLWVGGEEGLVEYDGSTWAAPEAAGPAPEFVDDTDDAPDGSLWLAADGNLYRLLAGQWTRIEWPSEGWLERVTVAPDGSVWAGYEGLGHYDPGSDTWQVFTPADGLVHPIVDAIHVTPEGVIWIGTDGGISRYVPPTR